MEVATYKMERTICKNKSKCLSYLRYNVQFNLECRGDKIWWQGATKKKQNENQIKSSER